MGNNQSSEKEVKIFKVIGKNKQSNYVRFYLDGDVCYDNGNYNHIDVNHGGGDIFGKVFGEPGENGWGRVQVGDYFRINLHVTREKNSDHTFGSMNAAVDIVSKSSSNGEFIEFLKGTNEYFGTMAQASRGYGQEAYQTKAWISYNLPPK